MPSLTDIYSQFSTTGAKLKRFGSDAFLIGTGNANLLPMDLPAGPDYVLGPGDNLTLNLWGGMAQRLNRSIDRQGQLELPEAGPVMISGLTIEQAQAAIQKTLDSQFHGEHVEISLGRLRTVRVYVVAMCSARGLRCEFAVDGTERALCGGRAHKPRLNAHYAPDARR